MDLARNVFINSEIGGYFPSGEDIIDLLVHPEVIHLSPNEVHIWICDLERELPSAHRYWKSMSTDEHERAYKFRFDIHRNYFIVRRGVLREILGRYLNLKPASLTFRYDIYGKPTLSNSPDRGVVQFNLSHSENFAIYAVTLNSRVGVDLERIKNGISCDDMAEIFFSQRELLDLASLPAEVRQEAFFACWTRKESYIKALGHGLMVPFKQFSVSLKPGDPAELLNVEWDFQEAFSWHIVDIRPNPSYKAALCIESKPLGMEIFKWATDGNAKGIK